jgi:hypothetical protein
MAAVVLQVSTNVRRGLPDVGDQIYLVPFDLSFCIVLEVAVALKPAFHELSEFLGKGLVVEEMVNA